MRKNQQVVLAARPGAVMQVTDFAFQEVEVQPLQPGQYLIQNRYLSMDAGFRKWMNEGADDNYLKTMELGRPVQSMILGHVIESRNPEFPQGTVVMGRTFWENFNVVGSEDFVTRLDHDG